MKETKVVNIQEEGFDVYIGRKGHGHDGYYGNPFIIGKDGNREQVLKKFKSYFEQRLITDPEFEKRVKSLRGKRLGCFCKPFACHGDIYKKYLEDEN